MIIDFNPRGLRGDFEGGFSLNGAAVKTCTSLYRLKEADPGFERVLQLQKSVVIMDIAAVEHGGQDPKNFEAGIRAFAHFLHGIEQQWYPHDGEVISLGVTSILCINLRCQRESVAIDFIPKLIPTTGRIVERP